MESSSQYGNKINSADKATSYRYRLDSSLLKLGMFVAELDRPWIDTPFLIEGLLLAQEQELSTLRQICHYVYVDLDKSLERVVQDILRAHKTTQENHASTSHPSSLVRSRTIIKEEINSPPPTPVLSSTEARRKARLRTDKKIELAFDKVRAVGNGTEDDTSDEGQSKGRRRYQARSDLSISRETRGKFSGLVKSISSLEPDERGDSLTDKAFQWVRDRFFTKINPTEEAARNKKVRQAIRIDLVKSLGKEAAQKIKFVTYKDAVAAIEEIPKAKVVFTKSEETLTQLLSDIKGGKVPAIENVRESVDEMVDSMVNNPDALLWIARLREEHTSTYNHGVKVGLYMVALGRHLGFPRQELSNLGLIGMLADVGKTRLPKALLEKPGMLSPAEYLIAKEHVRLGLDALKETGQLAPEVELGIAQHHERMDGSGYPKGLAGDEISIYGRMAGIADCFGALITPRPYANPQAPQEALMSLYEWGEKSLHLPLIEQFIQAVSVFPVGSMVELSSGEICVVLAHNRARRLEPKVLILTWPDKTPIGTPIERDLMMQPRDVNNRPIRITRGLPAGAYGLKIRDYYGSEIAAANNLF
jgi:HD-GYP domain-containing protein (c-di-GMP phosphodiesterase class II)